MRRSLLLPVVLVLAAVPALAGDDAGVADLARRYLSDDAAVRHAAEAEVAKAPADVLREVLRRVREERAGDAEAQAASHPTTKDLVRLEARFLQVSDGAAKDLALLDAAGGVGSRVLSEEEQRRLLEALEKRNDVTQVTAPSITTYDRQHASVDVLQQTSYVKDIDVVGSDGAWVGDPVIGTVVSGVTMELTPRISPDRTEVLVDFRLVVSDLVRPMEEHSLKLGVVDAKIQMPELRGWKLDRRLAVPDGRTVLLGGSAAGTFGAPDADPDGRLVVLLTAKHTTSELPEGLIPPNFQPVPPPRRELPDPPGGR